MVVLLAIQCARFIWIAFAPVGPVGAWQGISSAVLTGNADTLKTFDPFASMSGDSGSAMVTSLPLTLFGVRVDQATGRGSAIIATADGVQQSFAVGDEVMPGALLKSVTKDSVTIDRAGVSERLFLDQSVPAPVVQPTVDVAPGPDARPDAPSYTSPPVVSGLRTGVAFLPRMEKGVVTGFAVAAKGAGAAFGTAGFLPGDIVTHINGAGFDSVHSAATTVGNIPLGATVIFTVERAGRQVTLRARVAP